MKSGKKQILNFLFIFGMLVIVLAVGLSGNEFSDAWAALTSMAPLWLALCVVAWFAYLLTDAWSIHYFLKKQNYRISFLMPFPLPLQGFIIPTLPPAPAAASPCRSIT